MHQQLEQIIVRSICIGCTTLGNAKAFPFKPCNQMAVPFVGKPPSVTSSLSRRQARTCSQMVASRTMRIARREQPDYGVATMSMLLILFALCAIVWILFYVLCTRDVLVAIGRGIGTAVMNFVHWRI